MTELDQITTYGIEVLQSDRPEDLAAIKRAVADKLLSLGLHRTVAIAVAESAPHDDAPTVGLWLGSHSAVHDAPLIARAAELVASGAVVIPVITDLRDFAINVPNALAPFNGVQWSTEADLDGLIHVIFEELGIEEKQRRVFLSHKRQDGLGAAEQIHDSLTHRRFMPFIDRFAISKGEQVQERIADALEEHAFMLLLETPEAHTSEWVYDELDYALSHGMGVLILTWPEVVNSIPGSEGIPRIRLAEDDLETDAHGFSVLNESALDHLMGLVEAAHASSLCRRRRYLITSIQDAAKSAGANSWIPLRGWRVRIEFPDFVTVVGTTPRLPTAHDLQHLATAASSEAVTASSVLVHSARALRVSLKEHLTWVVGERHVTVLPENAIGARW